MILYYLACHSSSYVSLSYSNTAYHETMVQDGASRLG
jgi:hypothetical protein